MAEPTKSYTDLITSMSNDPIGKEAWKQLHPNIPEDAFITFIHVLSPVMPDPVRRDALKGLASTMVDAFQISRTDAATAQARPRDVLRRGTVATVYKSIEVDNIDNDRDELAPPEPDKQTSIRGRAKNDVSWPSSIRVFKHQSRPKNARGRPRSTRPSKPRRTVPSTNRDVGQNKGQVSLEEALLWTPEPDAGWRAFTSFPATFKAFLEMKVVADYTSTEYRRTAYRRTIQNKELYVDKCLNHKILRNNNMNRPPTWGNQSNARNESCDQCTKQHKLCVRLVKVNEIVRLGIYPLPESRRGNATVTEVSYWINGAGGL